MNDTQKKLNNMVSAGYLNKFSKLFASLVNNQDKYKECIDKIYEVFMEWIIIEYTERNREEK